MSDISISETTETRHDPIDEMVALYLEAHPEVRKLIPAWAEDIEAEADGPNMTWTCSLTRGEVEIATIVGVDENGVPYTENPTVELPGDDARWWLMPHAALVTRLRTMIADLTDVTDILDRPPLRRSPDVDERLMRLDDE